VQARGLRVDLPHPSGGTVKLVGSPMRMSATPPRYDAPPPTLGQHTEQVLQDLLGYSERQIGELRTKGTI
jgi:formyl-CoA transferase